MRVGPASSPLRSARTRETARRTLDEARRPAPTHELRKPVPKRRGRGRAAVLRLTLAPELGGSCPSRHKDGPVGKRVPETREPGNRWKEPKAPAMQAFSQCPEGLEPPTRGYDPVLGTRKLPIRTR